MLQSTYNFFFFLFSFLLLVCSCFFFFFVLLLSIPASFFVPLVDVVLWCSKLSFTVTRFVLNPWRTPLAHAPNRDMLYSHLQHHNDTIIKQTQGQRRKKKGRMKTSFQIYLPLTLLQGFERVVEGLHVRGCWRPNINFIFWPHCYDRHVVSFLFSWCWGPLHQGFSEGPLGQVWLSLPHLVSRCLEFYRQLLWD